MVGLGVQRHRRCSKGWEDVLVRPSPLLHKSVLGCGEGKQDKGLAKAKVS